MSGRVSGFKTADHRERYLARYDQVVATRWTVERTELDVPTRFGTTHVRTCGAGSATPLVLIHPTTGSSAGWYPVIDQLSADRPVYAPDTMGTPGRSVQSEPISSGADLAAWLDDLLDALALPAVHLLGYSEGGWIAGLHAATTERPEQLRSLTLIEPAGAITAVSTRFIIGLMAHALPVLLARDKRRAVRRLNTWMTARWSWTTTRSTSSCWPWPVSGSGCPVPAGSTTLRSPPSPPPPC